MHLLSGEARSLEVLDVSVAHLLNREARSLEVLDVSVAHLLNREACSLEVLDASVVRLLSREANALEVLVRAVIEHLLNRGPQGLEVQAACSHARQLSRQRSEFAWEHGDAHCEKQLQLELKQTTKLQMKTLSKTFIGIEVPTLRYQHFHLSTALRYQLLRS